MLQWTVKHTPRYLFNVMPESGCEESRMTSPRIKNDKASLLLSVIKYLIAKYLQYMPWFEEN